MTTMTLDQLQAHGAKFQSKVRQRNRREYAASAFVILIFSLYLIWFPAPLMRLGSLLIIAGTLLMMIQLRRRGSTQALVRSPLAADYITAYREQLVRQRDALRSVWLWYFGPFLPGLIAFMAGLSLGPPRLPWPLIAGEALLTAAVFIGCVLLNRRGARQLQRRIEDLDTLRQQTD